MKTRSGLLGGATSPARPLTSDELITDDELAFGARLLREVGPLPRSEHRRRRVWARLQTLPSSRQRLGRRLVYVGAAITFSAVAASAAIGQYWSRTTTVVAGTMPAPVLVQPRPRAAGAPAVRAYPSRLDPPASPESPASKPADLGRATPVSRKARPTATRVPVPEAEPEAEILLRAMLARRGGNTKQVEALATEYRQKHPQGVLEEEAFMLSIEAAMARRDPNARVLAREYLARFPAGRFRSQAAKAITPSPR